MMGKDEDKTLQTLVAIETSKRLIRNILENGIFDRLRKSNKEEKINTDCFIIDNTLYQ